MLRRSSSALLLLGISAAVFGQPPVLCPIWTSGGSYGSGGHQSAAAACNAFASAFNAAGSGQSPPSYGASMHPVQSAPDVGGTCEGTFQSPGYEYPPGGGATVLVYREAGLSAPLTVNLEECEELDECEMLEGTVNSASYAAGDFGGGTMPNGTCIENGGASCMVNPTFEVCLGGTCAVSYVFRGGECAMGDDIGGETATGVNCASSSGTTVCFAASSLNCGTVNGATVCLDAVPSGDCTFLANGGMVCASDAGSPPGPTDAAGTAPAAPDGEFVADSDENGDSPITYNYYNSSTVNGSGTPTEGSGDGGEGEGEEEGVEGECDVPGACEGSLPGGGSFAEVDTFGGITGTFMGRVRAAPLVAAASSLGTSMPAGVCPAPSTSLPYINATITLDVHCTLWDQLSGLLSAVMLACWVFIGARVVLSA